MTEPSPWSDLFDAEKWKNLQTYAAERGVTLRLEHIEKMAAAYFAVSDIDPREVVIVEELQTPYRIVFYFATRDEMGIEPRTATEVRAPAKGHCQRCASDRVIAVSARCRDQCWILFRGKESEDYVPSWLGESGGDDLIFSLCLSCGQVQGEFPCWTHWETDEEDE